MKKSCLETSCEKLAYARGYCQGHYYRLYQGRPVEGPLGPRNFFVDGKKICPQCCKEKTINEYGKNSLSWCKACQALRHKKEKYGLSPADYQTLLANGCEICGSHEALVVDHNHQTNHIRGALCHYCNTGLGFFKDNLELLQAAISYLKGEKTNEVV